MYLENGMYINDYPKMTISREKYLEHCNLQKKSKVVIMCKPLSNIRNKSALELLELCDQVDRVPVDLGKLLNKIKVSCLPFDFCPIEDKLSEKTGQRISHILGALVTTDKEDVAILYRKEEKTDSHRYRFTVAHEIAHCCLSHYDLSKPTVHLRQEDYSDDDEEYAANVFAGELLIPEHSLKRIIRQLIIPSVQVLADIFAVSENVMKARLDYLKVCDNISGYNF